METFNEYWNRTFWNREELSDDACYRAHAETWNAALDSAQTAFAAHIHVAGSKSIDRCEKCGKDIRDSIHHIDFKSTVDSRMAAIRPAPQAGGEGRAE